LLSAGFDDGENSKRFDVLIDVFRRCHDIGLLRDGRYTCVAEFMGRNQKPILLGYDAKPRLPRRISSQLAVPGLSAALFFSEVVLARNGLWRKCRRKSVKCEHFGITTAEAMSAGCVPMVINAGGQPEILGDSGGGYLWGTPEQLIEAVRHYLALSPQEASQMSSAAGTQAETFGHRAFFSRAIELYTELGIPCRSLEELSRNAPVGV